jgi:hypothetical protein
MFIVHSVSSTSINNSLTASCGKVCDWCFLCLKRMSNSSHRIKSVISLAVWGLAFYPIKIWRLFTGLLEAHVAAKFHHHIITLVNAVGELRPLCTRALPSARCSRNRDSSLNQTFLTNAAVAIYSVRCFTSLVLISTWRNWLEILRLIYMYNLYR